MKAICQYFWNNLIAIDQLANTILAGDPDETISSRSARLRHIWYWNYLAYALDWIDPGHTVRALERDEGDRDLIWPPREKL